MGAIKNCLIFVGGAAAGAGSVWFFMNKKLTAQQKEMSDKIQEGIDQYIEARTKADKNTELKGSINNLYFPGTEAVAEEPTVSHSIWDTIEEPKSNIRQISLQEYDVNEENTHMSLTYFASDDMVATSDYYTPIMDPEVLLGENFRELISEADGGEAIYIFNENEEAMYEVIIDKYESLSDLIEERVDQDIEAYAAEG